MLIIGVKFDKFVTKSQSPTTPYGVPPYFVISIETQSSQKNPAYINILNNLEKQILD